MWRVLLLVTAIAVSADARPITKPSKVAATKVAKKKKTAKKPKRTAKTKRVAKSKRRRIARAKRLAKAKAERQRKLKMLHRVTVEEQSVQLADVGRVRYQDSMPPGFAWPASDEMMAVEKGCEAELDAAGIEWQRAEALGKIADPIVVPAMQFGGVAFKSKWDKKPIVIDCQLARMLTRLGPKLRALGVREVAFGSVYRNTLVRFGGVRGKALSRHALGLAMDIVSFTGADGREVVVETEYPKKDWLLLAIENVVDHDRDWRILLTPKNDPVSHKSHFHLEASVDFRE
jgi:hypothetical protein